MLFVHGGCVQVQALYHHTSLGTRVQLSLVRLTLLRAQPAKLSTHAERGRLLDSFCDYQRSLNVDDDDDPDHWDMALLLSGFVEFRYKFLTHRDFYFKTPIISASLQAPWYLGLLIIEALKVSSGNQLSSTT